ncbi:hypothetical protein Pla110_08560 [Polystyrenella longa]|uniref:Uncharacterized protein n=1 Tax=Polystyrenella longa TaxID=2528007 RepID=A0A518CIV8_9PLAN|nr:hypothetical protein [Polystyrenella longa]QDU79151.1 hypothetical protein Pla110_08560 [Polystyrenella longa]
MRVQLWLSLIAGLLILSAATNVHAQYGGYPAPVTGSYGNESGTYYQGGVRGADGASYYENSLPAGYEIAPNPYATGGYGGAPLPDRNVFERILGAPFEMPFQLNASFTRTRTKSPDSAVIGDSRVSTKVHFAVGDDDEDDGGDDDDDDDGGDPDVDFGDTDNNVVFITTPPGPGTVQDLYLDGTDPWAPVTVDEIYDEGPAGGLKLYLGLGDSGVGGVMLRGFWNQNYQTGRNWGDRSNLGVDFGSTPIQRRSETGIGYPIDEEIDYRLSVFNPGLPFYTGIPLELDPDNSLGDAIPWDVYVEMKFETQSYGAEITQQLSAVYESDNIAIRPILGVQYMGIREGFSLFGRQSGLAYSVTFPEGTITPLEVTIDDGDDDGDDDDDDDGDDDDDDADAVVSVPGQSDWFHFSDMVDTVVDSKVNSNLIGPEAGFATTIGGRNFRIVTESTFGLMANREEIKLRGSNVYNSRTYFGPDLLFDQTKTTTHLSPMISTSIKAQSNVLRSVPVLRDIDLFDEAVVSVGYNYTHIWEVARPGSTIEWNGAPLTPKIDVNREQFWIGGWEFGLSWNY